MSIVKILKSKRFWKNLLYAVVLYGVFYLFIVLGLRFYTHHGKSFPVPDFKGLKPDRVAELANHNRLNIEIIDSNYLSYLPKGSVIDQYPKPGIHVKKNRTIFLTVNAFNQAKVKVPNVMGMSYRQGKTTLESHGLKVGKLIYKPDFAKNNILNQRYKGNIIKPGQEIEKGQSIDLELGNGLGKTTHLLPNLANLNFMSAESAIKDAFFNLGQVYFDSSVKTYSDTIDARVYRQSPKYSSGARSIMGSKVNLWLTINPNKLSKIDTLSNQ